MSDFKRQSAGVQASTRSDHEEALATIGMRIRKAVADGYAGTAHHPAAYNRRVPLPAHLSEPPALSDEPTAETSSDLASWAVPAQALPVQASQKRKHEDAPEYGVLQLDENF